MRCSILLLAGALPALVLAEHRSRAATAAATTRPKALHTRVQHAGAGPQKGGLSTSNAVVSIFKNIVGCGMLAIPAGMASSRGSGLVPAVVLTLVICIVSAKTFASFGTSLDMTGTTTFEEVWAATIGPKSTWIVTFSVLALGLGSVLAYGCILGDIFSSIIPSLSRTNAIISVSVTTLLPLVLAKDLSALAFSSILGFGAVLFTTAFMVLRFADGTYGSEGPFFNSLPFGAGVEQVSLGRISPGTLILVNMLLTAYMAHMNGPRFYMELEDRTPENFQRISNTAFGLSALIYVFVLVAGYSTFGKTAQGVILNNYSGEDPLALVARIANGISVITSFPLLFTSGRDAALTVLKNTSIGRAVATSDMAWRGFSIALLALVVLAAIVTTDVGFVVSVQGSLIGAGLCFTIPALIYMGALKKTGRENKNALPWNILAGSGILLAVFGTIITCLETFTDILS